MLKLVGCRKLHSNLRAFFPPNLTCFEECGDYISKYCTYKLIDTNNLSIYLYLRRLVPSREPPSRGWPRQSCLQVSLFRPSLSAFHTSPTRSLSLILFHPIYPFHWWSPPYSLSLNCALMYLPHEVTFIHSYHMSLPFQCVSLHPLHHSAIHSHCCFTHTTPPIRVLITLSIPP